MRVSIRELSPLIGIEWFIEDTHVFPEFRRQGIATVLLKETIKHAKEENIVQFSGICEPINKKEAAVTFWFKYGFGFNPFGNPNDPNIGHGIALPITLYTKNAPLEKNYQIVRANKEQLHWIISENLIDISTLTTEEKNGLSAFVAVDEDKNIIGFLVFMEKDVLVLPLKGTIWAIYSDFIFVRPEFRQQEIGIALVNEVKKYAEEANIIQILGVSSNDENLMYWYKNNFGLYCLGTNVNGNKIYATSFRII